VPIYPTRGFAPIGIKECWNNGIAGIPRPYIDALAVDPSFFPISFY
jgi:hypothetical protein